MPTNRAHPALVTTGIHGWSRNPIYLGMFLVYGGIGIAARSPWILILVLPLASRHPLRRRGARGGVSGTALWRRLPRLQSPRAPLGVAVGRERGPCEFGDPSEIIPDRDRLSVARTRLLREDPDTPGGQQSRADAPRVRRLGLGLGYCPHLGRYGAACPADCCDCRARHRLWDAGRRVAGQPRPGDRWPPRLRADAAHPRGVSRNVSPGRGLCKKWSDLFDQGGAWAIILTRSLPYSVPEAVVFLAGLAHMPLRKLPPR